MRSCAAIPLRASQDHHQSHGNGHEREYGNLRLPRCPKAKAGRRDDLQAALLALIEPTRAEAGCLDYVLFEQRDEPGTFYMREAFRSRAALDTHIATPHFQAFAARMQALLAEPLRLIVLDQVSSS